jgi:hypothetical protein
MAHLPASRRLDHRTRQYLQNRRYKPFWLSIRNPHTRRANYRAAEELPAWYASVGMPSIAAVQRVHVAPWIEAPMRELAAPAIIRVYGLLKLNWPGITQTDL